MRLFSKITKFRFAFSIILGVTLFIFSGCDSKIGDSCSTNSDCSSTGGRICDTASPGGYCTIEGCSVWGCPSGSRCVSFYPVSALSVPCVPETEDALDADSPTDDCTVDEVCLKSGECAPIYLERRLCMKKCSSQDDCRTGYECRLTGTHGSQRVAADDEALYEVDDVKICAPGSISE